MTVAVPFETRALTRADLRSLMAVRKVDTLRVERVVTAIEFLTMFDRCIARFDDRLNMRRESQRVRGDMTHLKQEKDTRSAGAITNPNPQHQPL
jgi:hypothetical protein